MTHDPDVDVSVPGTPGDCGPAHERERDWWDRIGEMRWQHVVLAVIAFVVLCFAPPISCTYKSEPATTETSQ